VRRFLSLKLFILLFLCPFMVLVPSMGQAMERILDFKSVIQVNKDSTLTVTETITVQAEGQAIKRGIYRDLPMLESNAYGSDYLVDLEIKSVHRNGHVEPHFIEIGRRNQRLYIGDKDVFLKPGRYEYVITYVVGQQVAFLDNYDELAWNVTGNDWSFPIDKVQAIVKLPSGTAPLQQAAYTGLAGDTGQAYTVSSDQQNTLTFTTTKSLRTGEGLTVAVAWPRGVVEKPINLPQHTPPTERILDYDSHVIVKRNGLLEVTETIRIVCDSDKIYGGLWRMFSKLQNPLHVINSKRSVKRIIDIRRSKSGMDGVSVPLRMTESPQTLHVHWGPQSKYLAAGEHVFILSYIVDRQIKPGTDEDFLFWSAQGYGWRLPIEKAQVVIEYPPGARLVKPPSLTGARSHSQDKQIVKKLKPGMIEVHSKTILTPGQSLSVNLAWPAGTFSAPSFMRRLHYSFLDYFYTYLGGFFLLILLAYFLIVWHRVGRDPKKGVVIPLFEPPDKLSPAAVRYLDQRGEDNSLLSLSIVNMAVNRCLRIKETEESFELKKIENSSQVLSQEEQAVFNKLFKSQSNLELKSKNYGRFKAARRVLNQGLEKSYGLDYFANNYGWIFLGALLSLIPQGLVTISASSLEWGIFLAICLALCSGAAALMGFFTVQAWFQLLAGQARLFGVMVLTLFLALPIFALEYVLIKYFADLISKAGLIIFLMAPALVAVFFQLLRSYTAKGRELMDRIQGFALYLETTEEDRLQSLHPPEKTPELFERLLPYAQALDLEHAWCNRFASVLQAASQNPEVNYSPSWYSGAAWTQDTASHFMEDFSTQFKSSLSSASSRPRSRSRSGGSGSRFSGGGFSSGGGSSGSGGGGGGGGGW